MALALGLAAAAWVVAVSVFTVVHPPIFLFVILIVLAFRFWGPRRRMYR